MFRRAPDSRSAVTFASPSSRRRTFSSRQTTLSRAGSTSAADSRSAVAAPSAPPPPPAAPALAPHRPTLPPPPPPARARRRGVDLPVPDGPGQGQPDLLGRRDGAGVVDPDADRQQVLAAEAGEQPGLQQRRLAQPRLAVQGDEVGPPDQVQQLVRLP